MTDFQIKDIIQFIITIIALGIAYGKLTQEVKNLSKQIDEMKTFYQENNKTTSELIGSVAHLQGYLEAKKNGVKIEN